MDTNGRTIVVTGGAGFIGGHLCEELIRQGARVICIDNEIAGRVENLAAIAGHRRFRYLRIDLAEISELEESVDVVLHLASVASPRYYLRYPIETLKVGSAGTFRALELAAEHGARFVLASTSEVYGDPAVHPQVEDYWGNVNPVGPRSVYDESKRFSESATMAFHTAWGLNSGIVRIFNTYGPRMQRADGRVVPTFIEQALEGRPLTIAGTGDQTRSLCFVEDTVRALIAMALSDVTGPVNIGNPNEMTMLELADRVITATGSRSKISFIDLPQDDPAVRCPDISLARDVLDWKPEVGFSDGIAQTIEWHRAERSAMAG